MAIQKTIIQVKDLTKIYQMGDIEVAALNGVSLKIKAGEFVAIMGASGSGKSTLMNILGCLDHPTCGEYYLDGNDVSDLDKVALAYVRNQKIGFVFQSYNLLARTTALENVILPLDYDINNHNNDEGNIALAQEKLTAVGLGDRVTHMPHELSGGQRQRVAIARALINNPVILLADEPTGNLDSKSGDEIMQILHTLHQSGATIITVTHEIENAHHAERIITMRDGRVISDETNGTRIIMKAEVPV